MKETRCSNSGALLFHPGLSELETLAIKKENKKLKNQLDKLEILVNKLIEDKNV